MFLKHISNSSFNYNILNEKPSKKGIMTFLRKNSSIFNSNN